MARTIGLSDDAYDALAALKQPGESFSDLAMRLATEHRRRRDIRESAGGWPMTDAEADRLIADIYADRDRSGEGRPVP
jgi:predicted CopG family antitoxin